MMTTFDKDGLYAGLNCPLPPAREGRPLRRSGAGRSFGPGPTDPGSVKDFGFAKQNGNQLVSHGRGRQGLHLLI